MPKGTTINGEVYLKILQEKLPTFMDLHNCNYFQHDGAPCHNVQTVKRFLAQSNFELLQPWPGNLPDLNPIENCWIEVKKAVSAMKPTFIDDLVNKIKVAWTQKISADYCRQLCWSMPTRIHDVLNNKGLHSKY